MTPLPGTNTGVFPCRPLGRAVLLGRGDGVSVAMLVALAVAVGLTTCATMECELAC